MSNQTGSVYIKLDELVKLKIPALGQKGAENNALVLEQVALNGLLLPYDVFKNLKSKGLYHSNQYPTAYRRIKDLEKRGYLAEAGRRTTGRGKQAEESMYGLTWRGFIASLSIKQVRENIFQTMEKNPLLILPEKESILAVLKEIITPHELGIIAEPIFEAYLNAIPNIEMIRDDQLWIWFFAIDKLPRLPESFEFSKMPKDLVELLDKPPILRFVKEKIVPLIRQRTMEIKTMYEALKPLDQLCEYISKLDDTSKPSKEIREYMQKELPSNLGKKRKSKA